MKPTEYLSVRIENSPEDLTPVDKEAPKMSDDSTKVQGDEDRVITLVAKGHKWVERLRAMESELYTILEE
jgi:predicted nucleic acid-binding Zn ribbon protein